MVKNLTRPAQPKGGKGSKPVQKQALKPEASERVKVTKHRVTGRLQAWKGAFGWIIPDTKIDHPKAKARGGKIYLAQEDVEKDLHDEAVSFFVYADAVGLGAMHCIPAKGGAVVKGALQSPKQSAQQPKQGKGAGKAANGKAAAGTAKTANGKAANGKGANGKAAGKGDKAEKRPAGTPPDKEKRVPLDLPPVEGVVVKYANQVGWIKLDASAEVPAEHKNKLRKGTLFFHGTDVDGEEPKIGAQVMCFLYTDGVGMGGDTLQVLIQGDGTVPKPEGEEEEKKEKKEKKPANTDGEDRPKKEKGEGKGRTRGGKNKNKGEKKGEKKEKGPSGPNLERKRVTEVQVTGEVLSWTRKFGWLKSEEVDNPLLEKHDGKIYVHQKDLVGIESLEVGSTVSFHVYSDASGLGAEEVEQF